eukprot:CAMPEP_0171223410 /NCGR_PEP_ID=MMETSP0790-20130122/35763_1 /TAXON_ID=2925 /ORGANISM="Alexandrium catenella, Strain OF101" /LENGTH=55 /DNA_ID=CAMNT_0011689383 /DNA_START=9 /DNA_END=173 /DNA_ORIENTATION=-
MPSLCAPAQPDDSPGCGAQIVRAQGGPHHPSRAVAEGEEQGGSCPRARARAESLW